jgi:hypothetical protein
LLLCGVLFPVFLSLLDVFSSFDGILNFSFLFEPLAMIDLKLEKIFEKISNCEVLKAIIENLVLNI